MLIRTMFVLALALVVCPGSVGDQKKAAGTKESKKQKTTAKKKDKWIPLFDGKSLKGWEPAKGIYYEDQGKITVKDGSLVIGKGSPCTGVRWKGKFPKTNYEVELEGQRVDGNDFFCGMSFPVGSGKLTLILGGWGGWVTGLSCIDGYRAIDNETCGSIEFKNKRWYRIRIKVTKKNVQAFVDKEMLCDFDIYKQELTVTDEMEPCLPFGFATYDTTGALRKIRYRILPGTPPKK